MKRLRSDLGGSHTVVTYPPLDSLGFCDPEKILKSNLGLKEVNLYIHIAFCEFICPFCHYETTFSQLDSSNNKINNYLDCLLKEIETWQAIVSNDIKSVYIGGGTPTVLSISNLERIFEKIKSKWTINSIPICIETSPLTIQGEGGKTKLNYLKDKGINRFSIGVQSFSEKNLHRARKETLEQVEFALENLSTIAINYNIDLIQDLPDQTLKDIQNDIEHVDKYRPNQVTWYTLRVQEQAGWYTRIQKGAIQLLNSEESLKRRTFIIEKMEEIGYTARPGGRFSLRGSKDIYKSIRSGTNDNLLGIGTSSYSHNRNYFFRNSFLGKGEKGIKNYIDLINEKGNAISYAFKLSDYEFAASKMVKGIRYGIDINELKCEKYFNEKKKLINKFLENGYLESFNGILKISRKGLPLEEEICKKFFSKEMIKHLKH